MSEHVRGIAGKFGHLLGIQNGPPIDAPSYAIFKILSGKNFPIVSQNGLAWLESTKLSEYPWLVHAFSTRKGGASKAPCAGLNLGFTDCDKPERVEQNRRRFFSELAGENFTAALVHQVHSSHTFIVTRNAPNQVTYQLPGNETPAAAVTDSPAGDGLITAEPGVLLTIRIADCLPALLVDPRERVVAAIHAGWRGALARVIEKGVGDMRRAFGSDPQDLIAVLGPSIRACCFEVGEEVVEAFNGKFTAAERFFRKLPDHAEAATDRHAFLFQSAYPPGHAPEHLPAACLDLIAVAQDQLVSAGVKLENVLAADYCTACRTDLFFSHRHEGGVTGRQIAAIGIRKAVASG